MMVVSKSPRSPVLGVFVATLRDVAYRIRALKLTTPVSPPGSAPGISQCKICDPASLGSIVNTALRSDFALPGMYSNRPVRLSVTAMSVMACPP